MASDTAAKSSGSAPAGGWQVDDSWRDYLELRGDTPPAGQQGALDQWRADEWSGLRTAPEWLKWEHFWRLLDPGCPVAAIAPKMARVRHNLGLVRARSQCLDFEGVTALLNAPQFGQAMEASALASALAAKEHTDGSAKETIVLLRECLSEVVSLKTCVAKISADNIETNKFWKECFASVTRRDVGNRPYWVRISKY